MYMQHVHAHIDDVFSETPLFRKRNQSPFDAEAPAAAAAASTESTEAHSAKEENTTSTSAGKRKLDEIKASVRFERSIDISVYIFINL